MINQSFTFCRKPFTFSHLPFTLQHQVSQLYPKRKMTTRERTCIPVVAPVIMCLRAIPRIERHVAGRSFVYDQPGARANKQVNYHPAQEKLLPGDQCQAGSIFDQSHAVIICSESFILMVQAFGIRVFFGMYKKEISTPEISVSFIFSYLVMTDEYPFIVKRYIIQSRANTHIGMDTPIIT